MRNTDARARPDPACHCIKRSTTCSCIRTKRHRLLHRNNDNHHAYTYQQKLNEVYQWRNGVFNRVRDATKIQALSSADIARSSERPAAGGLLKSLRVAPYFFAYENFPESIYP